MHVVWPTLNSVILSIFEQSLLGICGSDNYIDKGVLFGIFPVSGSTLYLLAVLNRCEGLYGT